ncbi:DUF4157 domain-containing protein [Rhodanobacter sp. OK091]|uniref:eCIS core domain-containing protein n=1 Tax=Rhodanobacter sp. OK091 TaxID=1881037 RepID=UPI000922DA55|nr:DUF4157 domain-containing protein [Rhodanobacter sp. OK091]SHM16390.1 Phage-related protein [Rhodanobacter sp. OK091]
MGSSKATAEKSSSTASATPAQAPKRPFFAHAGGGGFFPPVQAKMTVGAPGDKFEQEADRTADKVLRMPDPAAAGKLQRTPGDKAQRQGADKLQRQSADKVQRREEEKIFRAPAGEAIQKAPEQKVQRREEEKILRAPAEQKVQRVEQKGIQRAEEKPVQRTEDPKVQRAEQKQVQRAEQRQVQRTEDPKVQRTEQKQVQRAEDPKVQRTEEKALQRSAERVAHPHRAEEKIFLAPDDKLQKKDDDKVQKAEAAPGGEHVQRAASGGVPAVEDNVQSTIHRKMTGGQPLGNDVRGFMEPRFGADFGNVRVHHDGESAGLNNRLGAKAFTYQNHIFFSRGQYQPGTSDGKQLLAHELTHTVQQGHAVQRSPEVAPVSAAPATPTVQRLGVQDALDKFADWAYAIPGYRLLTLVIGFNPINMRSADRSAANILRGLIELMPGGSLITRALDNHGVINKAATWVEAKLKQLGDIGAGLKQALDDFLDSLSWTDIFDLSGVWERAKRIFTEPISRLIDFAVSTAVELLKMIKDAILKPLAAMAQGTRGYDLLCVLLGADPITGEAKPPTADNLLGGFMKLIGQEEIWENIKKGNAIARAFAWFNTALSGLMGIVRSIPTRIIETLTSLTITDVLTVVGAFGKIASCFISIATDFISWGLGTIWDLLKIIFDVVKPGLMGYIMKTGAALKSILKNPMPFLGNLVSAAKLGFSNFAANFGTHLKAGLIDWLTGSLQGVYIPKAATLPELGKFAMSVLGITWAQIRGKIVEALGPKGERIMQGLELAFDVVKALVTGGVAAVWELIKEKLSDLKDQVISGIVSFVTDTIIKKAIPKLIGMFIPGAGFIPAIISIYDTIMVFVQKISKIIQVVTGFIDSIVTIAGGNISGAAKRVESILAGLLSLAISFLAGFLGLSKVTDKIMEVMQKVRAKVDAAIGAAVNWVVTKAKSLFARLFGGKDKPDDRSDEQKDKDKQAAIAEAEALVKPDDFDEDDTRHKLGAIKSRYRLSKLELVIGSEAGDEETIYFVAAASPDTKGNDKKVKKPDKDGLTELSLTRPTWTKNEEYDARIAIMKRHQAMPKESRKAATNIFNTDGTFKVGATWARRHVLSSYDMKDHYERALILPAKTTKTAGTALGGRGFAPATKDKSAIKPAAQALLTAFHNDAQNIWVGETRQNSVLQENVDPDPSMYDAEGDVITRRVSTHIQAMANRYAIPGSVALSVSNKYDVPVKTTYRVTA